MNRRPGLEVRRIRFLVVTGALIAAAIPYLIALWSPLRLPYDAVIYLARAGGIPLDSGVQQYPPGYPALLDGLGHLGLGTPAGFIGLNLVLLAAGLGAAFLVCTRTLGLGRLASALVCLAVLLSHTTSFFAVIPMSDVAYFAAAMLCLAALSFATLRSGSARWGLLGLAALLAAAGALTRTAGIALVAPVIYVAAGEPDPSKLWHAIRQRALLSVAIVVVLVGATVLFVSTSPYARDVAKAWSLNGGVSTVLDRWGTNVGQQFVGVGELTAQANCCTRLSGGLQPAFGAAGAALLAFAFLGWLRRRRFGFVDAFLVATAAVVVVHGSGAARLWIAAMPFLFVYAALGAGHLARQRPLKLALVLYTVFFVVVGAVWLVDSVRVTTSSAYFRHWAARHRMYYGKPVHAEYPAMRQAATRVLQRYEP